MRMQKALSVLSRHENYTFFYVLPYRGDLIKSAIQMTAVSWIYVQEMYLRTFGDECLSLRAKDNVEV